MILRTPICRLCAQVVHLGNRLRNHLRCFRLNLSLCNIGNRAGLWLAPAIGTIQAHTTARTDKVTSQYILHTVSLFAPSRACER